MGTNRSTGNLIRDIITDEDEEFFEEAKKLARPNSSDIDWRKEKDLVLRVYALRKLAKKVYDTEVNRCAICRRVTLGDSCYRCMYRTWGSRTVDFGGMWLGGGNFTALFCNTWGDGRQFQSEFQSEFVPPPPPPPPPPQQPPTGPFETMYVIPPPEPEGRGSYLQELVRQYRETLPRPMPLTAGEPPAVTTPRNDGHFPFMRMSMTVFDSVSGTHPPAPVTMEEAEAKAVTKINNELKSFVGARTSGRLREARQEVKDKSGNRWIISLEKAPPETEEPVQSVVSPLYESSIRIED